MKFRKPTHLLLLFETDRNFFTGADGLMPKYAILQYIKFQYKAFGDIRNEAFPGFEAFEKSG